MRYQPSHGGDDRVMTPSWLALRVVRRLRPRGRVMDPCAGSGAFMMAFRTCGLTDVVWCEQDQGRDFLNFGGHVEWLITNPPYGRFADFLRHGLTCADHIAFLVTVNHWWTKRRVRLVREAGFGYERLLLLAQTPSEWPSTGFQHGVMVVSRGYGGSLTIEDL